MLYYAQARSAFLSGAWVWWVIPPGVAITMTVLGLAFIAFSLERLSVLRDGRIAYCRLCRNELRRERYRADVAYARREIERQRRRRAG